MPKTLLLTPPIPRDPQADWLVTDPDRSSMIRMNGEWVDLGVPVEDEKLRVNIAHRLVAYYERLYSRVVMEDGFGSEELFENLDFIKDCILAWKLWGMAGQEIYEEQSAQWADANLTAYGRTI